MKLKLNIFLSMGLLFLVSCKISQKATMSNFNGLTYVLPLKVETRVNDEIIANNFDRKKIFFVLQQSSNLYWLFIIPNHKVENVDYSFFKVVNSNRRLLIDTSFYPIVLGVDYDFGSTVGALETLKKRNSKDKNEIVRAKYIMYETEIVVKFKKDGSIVN